MRQPLKVLHVHSGNMYGGVERSLVTIAAHRGLTPEIAWRFALSETGRLSRELADAGAAPVVIGRTRARRPWTVWAARAQLRALLRRDPCDVAVVHSLWGLALFGPTLRRAGLKLVLWVHGVAPSPAWEQAAARRIPPDFVIANSGHTARQLPAPFAGLPTEVVHPPEAPQPPTPGARARLRAELGVGAGTVVLVSVARLEPAKGQHVLLRALAGLPGDWRLWVAGGAVRPAEREHEALLHAEARRLGLEARVAFLGERTDIADLLDAADIYVQPNTAPEGFGLALVEALAAGRPVVATDCGPTAEMTTAATARLVPPGDAAALRDALAALLADAGARQSMGASGPHVARALSDPAGVLPRLAVVLRQAAR